MIGDGDELIFPKLKKATAESMPKVSFIVQEKLDGESLMLARHHAYGRRISEVSGRRENKWSILPPWIQRLPFDTDTIVHGELHVIGGTSSDVKTALVEGRETDWSGELCNRLRFTAHTIYGWPAFDALDFSRFLIGKGHCVPRMVYVREDDTLAMSTSKSCFCSAHSSEHEAIETVCDQMPHNFHQNSNHQACIFETEGAPYERLLALARDADIEGFVLKEFNTGNQRWWKLKVTWTYDVVVLGWKPGQGMHYGDVGALMVGVFGGDKDEPIEVASVGGMTEVERKWMSDNREKLRGMVCEVEANGVASQGRLHHPRFIRWREDKNAHDCTIDQLEKGSKE